MRASDYLKMRFKSDRRLALSVQYGFKGAMRSIKDVSSDIFSGFERASWYTSCLVPKYNDVCQELADEELRTLCSIQSIYRYKDVLQHMLYLYFDMVYDDIKEGNPKGAVRDLVKAGTGVASHMVAAGGTRYTFAVSISQMLAQSDFLSKAVAERLSSRMPMAIFMLQFYGIQQKAALAARRLKSIEPKFYWILYYAKLEMLYYFIEPLLSDIMKRVKSGEFGDLNKLAREIGNKYGV